MRSITAFIATLFLCLLLAGSPYADTTVFGPDGRRLKSQPTDEQPDNHQKKIRRVRLYRKSIIKHIKRVPYRHTGFQTAITDPEAEAAAAAGYKIGQTVKIIGNTVYKLSKEPQTGHYILTRHGIGGRMLNRNTPETPPDQPSARPYSKRQPSERLNYEDPAGFFVSYSHVYGKTDTVITKRKVKTTGATEYTEDPTIKNEKDIFYTKQHADLLAAGYTFRDHTRFYVDIGLTHATFSDFERLYGAGLNTKLYQTPAFSIINLSVAFFSAIHAGDYTEEYTSEDGEKYIKTSEFTRIDAGIETGVHFSVIDLYGGLIYAFYDETTIRKPVATGSGYDTIIDTLEAQNNVGVVAGIAVKPSGTYKISLTGEAICRNSLTLSVDYLF